jgi:hypothetical protein
MVAPAGSTVVEAEVQRKPDRTAKVLAVPVVVQPMVVEAGPVVVEDLDQAEG